MICNMYIIKYYIMFSTILTSPVNQTSNRPMSKTLLFTTGISDTNLATISAVVFGTSSEITGKNKK